MKDYLSKLRKDYGRFSLFEEDVERDPVKQLEKWISEAANYGVTEPNAFVLSTSDRSGRVSGRILLLRNLDARGLIFYTNYESLKARQIEENSYGAATFFWADVERQVRVEGQIRRIPSVESLEYFKSRPRESQLGAWASPQSQVIPNRQWLEEQVEKYRRQFEHQEVPKPPHWGGYCLSPVLFEFWQGRPNRLHDRIQYILIMATGTWKIDRLAP
ncbi:MAG: pyridoxamine 5'-phosphate oxidase [Flavobacteriales bacterium]|nr:pyridoxamine 5'-phosphate oxidase [Flavobacteriales bacterium]MDW8410257.1 pyridoxamine 5'-phosphate oxidase [Flavobacteriales bacterium]